MKHSISSTIFLHYTIKSIAYRVWKIFMIVFFEENNAGSKEVHSVNGVVFIDHLTSLINLKVLLKTSWLSEDGIMIFDQFIVPSGCG